MAFTEHCVVEQFPLLHPNIGEGYSSRRSSRSPRASWRESSRVNHSMPTYDHYFTSRNSGTGHGEIYLPALETEDDTNNISGRVGQKRRRTAVVMEPGSLLSTIAGPPPAHPYRNSVAWLSNRGVGSHRDRSGSRSERRRRDELQKQKLARKVSLDPVSGVEQHERTQLPARVSPESGLPRNDRARSIAREGASSFYYGRDTHFSSLATCHDHAMFQCFQPPMPSLASRLSMVGYDGKNSPAPTTGVETAAACAATPTSSVSFSYEDLEPLPLYQQESGFFHQSPAAAMSVHRSTTTTSSTMRGYCKRDDRHAMMMMMMDATADQETIQTFNHKRCDDEDYYPSWEIFADIENVPSDLRDDDVLTYLEPNKEGTSMISCNTTSPKNLILDSVLLSYPTTTPSESPAPPSQHPSLFPELSSSSTSPHCKATFKLKDTSPKHGPDTLKKNVPNEPFAMKQKKSRFKHYKSWGVLGTWGIRDVKKKLREFKLSTSGNKDKLLDRLRQAFAANECEC